LFDLRLRLQRISVGNHQVSQLVLFDGSDPVGSASDFGCIDPAVKGGLTSGPTTSISPSRTTTVARSAQSIAKTEIFMSIAYYKIYGIGRSVAEFRASHSPLSSNGVAKTR
jgi:hypothetical protein